MPQKRKSKTKNKISPSPREKAKPAKRKSKAGFTEEKDNASKAEKEKNYVFKDKLEKTEKESQKIIKNETAGDNNHLAKWTAPEFIKTPQETSLYYVSVAASLLMIFWSLFQGEYVVVITFLVLLIVVIFQIYHEPRDIEYKIDLDGVSIGEKLYKYEEIKSFEMAQKGEENILKIGLKNAILPVKEIHLANQNPYYIQAALEYFLPEEEQKESLIAYERDSEEEYIESEEEEKK